MTSEVDLKPIMSAKIDLEIMRRDIRVSRNSFNGSNRPLDMPVRVWIDVAEQLTDEVEQLRELLKQIHATGQMNMHWQREIEQATCMTYDTQAPLVTIRPAMSDKLPVGLDVDENGTTRLIQRLRAEVEELTAILNTHRRQYTDGRLPTWTCEATDEEIIDILLPASQSELADLRAENEQLRADVLELNGMVAMLNEQIVRMESEIERARGVWSP